MESFKNMVPQVTFYLCKLYANIFKFYASLGVYNATVLIPKTKG